MKILTNLKQLRNIDKYNPNCAYIDTNVFTLCQENPNIIISGDGQEIYEAFYDYPNISFIGPNLPPPNKHLDIPKVLLDERLLTTNVVLARKSFEIGYICKTKTCPYIKKLSSLGNLKIMGPIKNINTIYENINESMVVPFYKLSKIPFATDLESAILALNVRGKCIGTPEISEQCCYVTNIENIKTREDLLDLLDVDTNRILDILNYTYNLSYKTFFENLSKRISDAT